MADTCRLWDYILDTEGNPVQNAVVSATLAVGDSVHADNPNGFIAPGARTTYTNASGYFEMDLIPSSGLDIFSQYRIMIPRLYYSKLVAIPDASGVRLRDI